MKIVKLLALTATTLFVSLDIEAQGPDKYLREANELFISELYSASAEKYIVAEPKVTDLEQKGFVLFRIGECYRLSLKPAKAEQWYDKAATAQYYKTNPDVHYNWGLVLLDQAKWEEAESQFKKYTERGGDKSKGDAAIKSSKESAEKASQSKLEVVVENYAAFNTPFFDFSPMWADKDEESIIFSSSRPEGVGNKSETIYEDDNTTDIFISVADKKGKFDTPKPLSTTVNTPDNEGVAVYGEKFKLMYFTRCMVDNSARYGCDIYTAKRSGDNYTEVDTLVIIPRGGEEPNDSTNCGNPALTQDGNYLIFASNMEGGKGGRDLWYLAYDKKSETWGKPVNLSSLNTPADEMFPTVTMRGGKEVLFFASSKPGGLGGLDIYKTERSGDLTYGPATGLGYPINSSSDDFGIIYYPESKKANSGFFTSNRPGGRGSDDIYRFDEPPTVICFKGNVYDKKTGAALSGVTVTAVVGPEGKQYNLTTDGNGGFSLCNEELKNEDVLTVDLKKDKYISPGQDKVNIGKGKSRTITREYFMEPEIIGVSIRMPMVYYIFDKTLFVNNADTSSNDSLNYLFDLMVSNPTYVIQLESHTDARGDAKYNEKLSLGRAQACVDYLIGKGIDPLRLKAAGIGERSPATLDKDLGNLKKGDVINEANIAKLPAEMQELAHNLNRRTEFRILSKDFKPKQ